MATQIPPGESYRRNYERAPWCYLFWGAPVILIELAGQAYQGGLMPLAFTGLLWSAAVAWIGIGCFLNGRSCGRVHCKIDGAAMPLLAFAGVLNALSVVSVNWNLYWLVFAAVLVASFAPEFTWKRCDTPGHRGKVGCC